MNFSFDIKAIDQKPVNRDKWLFCLFDFKDDALP